MSTSHRPIPSATEGATREQLDTLWPLEYYEPFMQHGDPIADKIMQLLYAEGRADAERTGNPTMRPRRVLQFLTTLINQMSIPDPEVEHPFASDPTYSFSPAVREAMREFLRETRKLPPWADFEMIQEAQDLYTANPIIAGVLLACISLPVLYSCGKGGVQVLMLTDQLVDKVRRRVVETSQLIFCAMTKDSFLKQPERSTLTYPPPAAIEGILRVRLLHSATRTVIYEFWQDGLKDRAEDAKHPGEPSRVRSYQGKTADKLWQEDWGIPIHQHYMSGTLMTFSYISLYGLEQMGVILSDRERKAYMHFWNVFGYITGVKEELLLRLDFPRTLAPVYQDGKPVHEATGKEMYETGRAIYTRMVELNRSVDDEAINASRELNNGVIQYLEGVIRARVPHAALYGLTRLPVMMMVKLLSKDDRKLLGVRSSIFDWIFIPIVNLVLRLRGILIKTPLGIPANGIAKWLLKIIQDDVNEVYAQLEKQTGVRYSGIPMELQQHWGLIKTN